VSPEGDYVAAGSLNYFVYLFDSNGTVLWKYNAKERVYGVAVSTDGAYVAASSGNTVTLLNRAGEVVQTYEIGHPVFGAAITPDGTKIAVGTGTGGEGVVLLPGAEKTLPHENVSAPPELKSMAEDPGQSGDPYLLRSFILEGEDYVPDIAHEFDGAAIAGIVRQEAGMGPQVAVRMTVGKAWAEEHGGSENIHLVTVAPAKLGQFPLRAEVLKTKFIGYDPEGRLVFEGYSPYQVTKYGMMAEGDGTGTGAGREDELPLTDLFWRDGGSNATVTAGNTTTDDNAGNNSTGDGMFPTLPLQIPRPPSFQE